MELDPECGPDSAKTDVLKLLGEALAHARGTHSMDDLCAALVEGKLKLWVGDGCVGVTEFLQFPQRRVMNVFLAAGDLDALTRCKPGMEAFARGGGANAVMFYGRVTGRTGWARIWPDYEPAWVCMWKDL